MWAVRPGAVPAKDRTMNADEKNNDQAADTKIEHADNVTIESGDKADGDQAQAGDDTDKGAEAKAD